MGNISALKKRYIRRKLTESRAETARRLDSLCYGEQGHYGLCPRPMDSNTAIDELCEFFLGKHWYCAMPLGRDQMNHVIVATIEDLLHDRKHIDYEDELRGITQ